MGATQGRDQQAVQTQHERGDAYNIRSAGEGTSRLFRLITALFPIKGSEVIYILATRTDLLLPRPKSNLEVLSIRHPYI